MKYSVLTRKYIATWGLGAAACVASGCTDETKSAAQAKEATAIPTVTVVAANKRDLPLFIESVGLLDGYINAEIRARVSGYLHSQEFKEGSTVKEGDLLFRIDPREYEAAVGATEASLRRAQVARSKSQTDLSRAQNLRQAGVVSKQDVDNATAGLADSNAQVEEADAQLKKAKLDLSYTRIQSPISGVAGIAQVRVGNLVGKDDATLLTTISQIDPIRVNFTISETDYMRAGEYFQNLDQRDLAWARRQFARVAKNAAETKELGKNEANPDLEIVLSDGSIYPYRGLLIAVDRAIDRSTGSLSVQALLPNPDKRLKPGQYARVRIPQTSAGQNVLAVPQKALLSIQGTYSVAVVDDQGKVAIRRVKLGASSGEFRVVQEGIDPGELIVTEGLQKIRDGMAVNVSKE